MEIYVNEKNDLHRDNDEPALVSKNMSEWCVNNKLHRAKGPAVKTHLYRTEADGTVVDVGTEMYYWKGIHIEKEMWDASETMDAEQVFKIENLELRRCMIEKIGYETFLKRSGDKLQVLDRDKDTGAVLYRVENPGDESILVVRVLDGTPVLNSDGQLYTKEYFLRVPPTLTSSKEAIAWTFRMTVEEYRLEVET